MESSGSDLTWRSIVKGVSAFAAHQLNVFLGISILSAVVVNFAVAVIYYSGGASSPNLFRQLLTGTPFYPIHLLLAFILGSLLSLRLRHRTMLWVWLMPLAILLFSIIVLPISDGRFVGTMPNSDQTVWSHYFGWGCQRGPCINQFLVTLPFYVGSFYSLGASLARKVQDNYLTSKIICSWYFAVVGSLLVLAALAPVIVILYLAAVGYLLPIPEWLSLTSAWWIWPLVVLCGVIFPTAMGLYLLNSALSLRKRSG